MPLVNMCGPGSRLTAVADSGGGETGDVFSDTFDYAVSRSADFATKLSAFQSAGWDSGEFTAPTGSPAAGTATPNAMGWVYTATPASLGIAANPSGSSRVLVQEFFPQSFLASFVAHHAPDPVTWQDCQPNPYIQWGNQNDTATHLPANVWIRYWTMLVESFTVDIGDGAEGFTSTVATRDKTCYPSRENEPDPLYGASFPDGLNWDFLHGAVGYESAQEHLSVPATPSDEMFICLDTGGAAWGSGADNELAAEIDQHKLYQNLNNTTGKIVKGVWTEVTLHLDTSQAGGCWRAWIKKQGQSRVQVAHWVAPNHPDAVALGGATADFTWPLSAPERTGHKAFQLNSVINGNAGGTAGDHMLVYGSIDIATSLANLPDYDA